MTNYKVIVNGICIYSGKSRLRAFAESDYTRKHSDNSLESVQVLKDGRLLGEWKKGEKQNVTL